MPARDGTAIVLAHGCFDPLHAGHIEHLRAAKRFGDRLVVSVTGDSHVGKGAWRPHFSAEDRVAHLRSLSFVDDAVVNDAPNAVPMIERFRPQVYVKGIDYAGQEDTPDLGEEIAAVRRVGGRFEATASVKMSASRLLARWQYGDGVADYLDGCRQRGFWPRIVTAFERAHALTAVFVGETIIDEYRYVSPLAKPSKEFILAVAAQDREEFRGGVIAAARHAERLCRTSYVTQSRTEMRKTRFIGRDFGHKLFEVYSAPTLALEPVERRRFLDELDASVRGADVVIVTDFGHGLIDDSARLALRGARFLAVNAQSNAGNQGFNSVTRYRHPEYICVDAPEARLAAQDQHGPIEGVLKSLVLNIEPGHLIVTAGKEGAYWRGGRVPALAVSPKDTIGAGDCFLAVTAPLIAAGLGEEEAALVGNVAGAMKTEIVGHRAAIDAEVLFRTVESILK